MRSMSKILMIFSAVFTGSVIAQQPHRYRYYDELCWTAKTDLKQRIKNSGANPTRKKLGIAPLVWITVEEQGFDFANLDDLAKMIHRVRPDLGSAKKIKQSLIDGIRADWVKTAKEQGVRSLRGSIEGIFSGSRLSMIVDGHISSAGNAITWEFELVTGIADDVVQLERHSLKLAGSELSVMTHIGETLSVGEANLNRVIESLFDREKLMLNLKDAGDAVPEFSKGVLEYLERHQITGGIQLSSDDLLKILARGNEEVFDALRRAEASGIEQAAKRMTTWEFMANYWRYGAALAVVGTVAYFWEDLFPSKERKHIRTVLDRVPRGMREADRSWIEGYLVDLVEDMDLEDTDAINATINGMSCDAAYALWLYVTTYKPF